VAISKKNYFLNESDFSRNYLKKNYYFSTSLSSSYGSSPSKTHHHHRLKKQQQQHPRNNSTLTRTASGHEDAATTARLLEESLHHRHNSNEFDDELNRDDLSQINDLSSIDSLLASIPFSKPTNNTNSGCEIEKNTSSQNFDMNEGGNGGGGGGSINLKKENFFVRLWKNFRFSFAIIKMILFDKRLLNRRQCDDLDMQNAAFIFYSNFLIGLGIITVRKAAMPLYF
jgi:hypothetical protein